MDGNGTKKVLCTWATASETNNNYFNVERSEDAVNFENIGTVKGAGNSNTIRNYQFIDNISRHLHISPSPPFLYYRLRQTDFDGSNTLSETRALSFGKIQKENLNLFYENDKPVLRIESSGYHKINACLYNLSGQQLWLLSEVLPEGISYIDIDGGIAAGIYLLRIELEDRTEHVKVLIK